MLTHSRDSVKTIGFRLGFTEPSNFIHAFTRWAGVSPTQFRRSASTTA
ncbi:MAG: helix-turn-helix domain-containing protein [Gammaproteobacteria bacterium]